MESQEIDDGCWGLAWLYLTSQVIAAPTKNLAPWGLLYISPWNHSFFKSKFVKLQMLQETVLLHMVQNKNKKHDAENRMPKFVQEPYFWNFEN